MSTNHNPSRCARCGEETREPRTSIFRKATLCPACDDDEPRRLYALETAAQGLRDALAQSRIAMSITPATDTMPGYLAELHDSYIIPTLEKVDSELRRFDALKEGKQQP